jgi:hypothetical protein
MNVVIYNATDTLMTIAPTGTTVLRLAGTSFTTQSPSTRTLQKRGIATILYVGGNDYVISGPGLL